MEETTRESALSRRDFILKGSTAAAVAVAGLSVLGAPAIVRGQNLNSNLNVGVIGTGSRGCYLTRILTAQSGVTISDVCDVYPPNLEAGKTDSKNEKVRAWEDWRKILEQKDVDAVVVAPPLFLHVPCSVASLDAGKHVYSEKSMGMNVKELNAMGAAVKAHTDKVYMVGFQSRMMESFNDAKKLVQSGSFGKILQFYVHYDNNRSWRAEGAIDPKWERVLNWRLYREYCGGILTELLTHEIDMVLDVLGTMPVSGACTGKIMVYNDGREHFDSLMGHWEMEDGVIGVASGGLANARWGSSWAIHGTHGTLEFTGSAYRIFWEKETRHLQQIGIKHKFTQVKLGQSLNVSDAPMTEPDKVADYRGSNTEDSSIKAVQNFLDCVRKGGKPVMDYESCRRPSIAALMLYESSFNGGRKVTREEIEAQG